MYRCVEKIYSSGHVLIWLFFMRNNKEDGEHTRCDVNMEDSLYGSSTERCASDDSGDNCIEDGKERSSSENRPPCSQELSEFDRLRREMLLGPNSHYSAQMYTKLTYIAILT